MPDALQPDGQWHIASLQKNIAGSAGHNYVALIDPQGNIVRQYDGVPSQEPTARATPGNFLTARETFGPDQVFPSMANQNLFERGSLARPVVFRNGKGELVTNLAADLMTKADTPENAKAILDQWNAAVAATNADLQHGQFLYVLGDVDSDSVWATFLRKLGIPKDEVIRYGGTTQLAVPGTKEDISTAPSNNWQQGQPGQAEDYQRQFDQKNPKRYPLNQFGDGRLANADPASSDFRSAPQDSHTLPPADRSWGAQTNASFDPSETRASGAQPLITPTSALRTAIEQRAEGLGIGYASYMPTSALLAAIHQREADEAQPHELGDVADRIENEMDTIGLPLLRNPEADAPPPQGLAPLTRNAIEARASRLGIPYTADTPSDQLVADIHSTDAAAAPPAAAATLANHIERDIDQMGALASLPGFSEEQDDA